MMFIYLYDFQGGQMVANIAEKACVTVKPPYDAIANLFGDIYVFKVRHLPI